MSARSERSIRLRKRLGELSDEAIVDLIERAAPTFGWGSSRVVDVDGEPVFVKCLPLTAVELANLQSTRDRFGLPLNYHYGVGSAGFGAWRELAAHVTASDWAESGACAHFPLLHHHRVLQLPAQTRRRSAEQLDRYVRAWGDDEAVRRFIEAREASTHAIAVFTEQVPHVLMDWLPEHQDALGGVIDHMLEVTQFLRAQGVAHLDLNPSNVLTDGTSIVVADFGLFLDPSHELADDERAFLDRHRFFDVGEFIASLDWPVPGREFEPGPEYRAALEPFRPIIDEMTSVFGRLTTDRTAPSTYDDDRVAGLLASCLERR